METPRGVGDCKSECPFFSSHLNLGPGFSLSSPLYTERSPAPRPRLPCPAYTENPPPRPASKIVSWATSSGFPFISRGFPLFPAPPLGLDSLWCHFPIFPTRLWTSRDQRACHLCVSRGTWLRAGSQGMMWTRKGSSAFLPVTSGGSSQLDGAGALHRAGGPCVSGAFLYQLI